MESEHTESTKKRISTEESRKNFLEDLGTYRNSLDAHIAILKHEQHKSEIGGKSGKDSPIDDIDDELAALKDTLQKMEVLKVLLLEKENLLLKAKSGTSQRDSGISVGSRASAYDMPNRDSVGSFTQDLGQPATETSPIQETGTPDCRSRYPTEKLTGNCEENQETVKQRATEHEYIPKGNYQEEGENFKASQIVSSKNSDNLDNSTENAVTGSISFTLPEPHTNREVTLKDNEVSEEGVLPKVNEATKEQMQNYSRETESDV